MSGLWPAWVGALVLGLLTPMVFLVTGRMLGVSGFWARALSRREQEKVFAAYTAALDQKRMDEALERATLEAFGPQALTLPGNESPVQVAAKPSAPLPWTANVVFLCCLTLGGTLAALLRGAPSPVLDPSLSATFGSAWPLALLGGGFLVGLGARWAGGCTSGHGLSGCGSLQPGSLVATAAYFLAGVVVSFAIAAPWIAAW